MMVHKIISQVTENIVKRSNLERTLYLKRMESQFRQNVRREEVSSTNFAHAIAAEPNSAKIILKELKKPNIGIITAYNDVISSHQPYVSYPDQIKRQVILSGATAQVAGGVPAMCDGVTQGQVGMEMSLFSRDVIAMATAVSLSHNVFDGVILLGMCDKIVPGMLIGCLPFGYLPCIFVSAGPMATGISNKEKAEMRKLFAEGKIGKDSLLDSELKSYHSPGVCTFYGTSNTNQMILEFMGLQIPGSPFVLTNTPLRTKLTDYAALQAVKITAKGQSYRPLCDVVTEKSLVNAIIGLLATGGSTNHTLHIPAIAKACGITITWDDFAMLSKITPLLTKIYPNGSADINQFYESGGSGVIIRELLNGGLLHDDVKTVVGNGLNDYTKKAYLTEEENLIWKSASLTDENTIRPLVKPFANEGGLRVFTSILGRAVTKVSAIDEAYQYVKAPARVFSSQEEVMSAYRKGELNKDVIVVVKYQGPQANGMPELHGLSPILASLQDQGYKVGLITDGRMSGASGKVPNAIHLTPEALQGGNIAKIFDGDIIELDLLNGVLNLFVTEEELAKRKIKVPELIQNQYGLGRELFQGFRERVSSSESGASSLIVSKDPRLINHNFDT